MSRWECIVCGWVYDESRGDPDHGVAAGTRWEDVPADWLCPDCGVGKEDFELLEDAPVVAAPHHQEETVDAVSAPVVIIGTGLAGYGLAREFRKLDQDTPLILITADDGRSYSKPMLSTGYTKNTAAADLVQLDAGSMGAQLKCSVWTMTRVTGIDTASRLVKLGDSETAIHYRDLVLALGADTITPPISGDGLELVYSINDLMDYHDFRTAMQQNAVRKVCLVGAGLIGCEFANDLLNGGFEVEAVDPLGYCLPTLLPEAAGRAVQRGLEALGARFRFGNLVKAVNRNPGGSGLRVVLDDGSDIDADIVVSAVGVRPRTQLAREAGIEVGRGIVTDRYLRTSADHVFALGDCAEVAGHVLVYVAPLMAAARALAKTLAGEPAAVSYPAMPVTIKTPACPVVVSPPPAGAAGGWDIDQQGNDVVARFIDNDGKLAGFALTGDGIRQKMALQKELPAILA